ncbi:MAG: hypothetical protein M3N52_11050, partial [Actinomycetota bacterium]|nr:hypothetical protein [Actinomycetota bacterium]
PLTGGRSDVDPQLALVYAAGSGEGAFGLGWSLEVSRVRRRLDTGVPRYLDPIDATTPDSDVFTAEGEDLVPVLDGGRSRRRPRTLHGTDYVVCSYGPRTEGSAGTSTRPRFTARTWPSTPDCSPAMRCRRRDASSGAGSARPSSRWRPTW